MWRKKWVESVLCCFGLICWAITSLAATPGPFPHARTGNSTLRLPNRVAVEGYALVNCLPGITFDQPVGLATPPLETNRLFIVERTGKIYVITNLAIPNKTLFLDLSGRLAQGTAESGLLGLAFHPDFALNGYFFVFGTMYASTTGFPDASHDVLARFRLSENNLNAAAPDSETIILAQADDSDQHNGGDIKFGRDGYLYVAMGERLHRDPAWVDQTPVDRDLHGAILRIDVDGRPGSLSPNPHPASTTNYWIPPDNPFVGITKHHGIAVSPSQVRTELYATGLRNPWRITFDPATGDLYAADVGEARHEEINLVVPGADYGWPYFEGALPFRYQSPPIFDAQPPLFTYDHGSGGTNGECIIGGPVYRGAAIPALEGKYLFADFLSGHLWSLERQSAKVVVTPLLSGTIGISAFGTDPRDGEVLVTHLFEGTILRLVHVPPGQMTDLPRTLEETGIFADLTRLIPNPGILPYELNVPFWSDHANKQRWFCLPETNLTIGFESADHWTFPAGAVWVKHFELEMTNGQPASARRLETRVLVNTGDGFYGLTYRWGDSTSNAFLVAAEGQDERFIIRDTDGTILREQEWRYPSQGECTACHNKWGGQALGFNTAQLNRRISNELLETNQLQSLAAAGYFNPAPTVSADELPSLAGANDPGAPLEFRVRSFLQANCTSCHMPGAPGFAQWQARVNVPLAASALLSDRTIKPGSLQESPLYHRLSIGWPRPMPPIGTRVLNTNAANLLANWITNLPPAPWAHQTIGEVVHFGGSIVSNGTYHVGGTGRSLESGAGAFQFLSRPFTGTAAHFVARLTSQTSLNGRGTAGIMLHAGTNQAAPFVMVGCRDNGTALTLIRPGAETPVVVSSGDAVPSPQWLRLLRVGNDLEASRSDDGTNWVTLRALDWPFLNEVDVGFAVNSGSPTAFNNAVFDEASYLSIVLTSAPSGAIQQPANIHLHAAIQQTGRRLTKVEFYDGSFKLAEITASPYSLTVSNLTSGPHVFYAHAVDETGTVVRSLPLACAVQPPPTLLTAVTQDNTNSGNWLEHYGADGHIIVGWETNLPSSVVISAANASSELWAVDSREIGALLKRGERGRVAGAWTSTESLTVSVQIRDGDLRVLSLYFLDWGTTNARTQRVEFLDPATGGVLSTHTISNFSDGLYLSLILRGHVDVRLSSLAGPSAVLSGIFFDKYFHEPPVVEVINPVAERTLALPADVLFEVAAFAQTPLERVEYYLNERLVGTGNEPPFSFMFSNLVAGSHSLVARAYDSLGSFGASMPVTFQAELPRAKAVFLREDAQTRGNWINRYGTDGFLLAPLTNWWPADIPYTVEASTFLQPSASDADYVALPNSPARAWPLLFSYSTIFCDLNLADGHPRSVALYFFDTMAYEQVVTISDLTGKVLDVRTVSTGSDGRYLVWNLEGHVRLGIRNPTPGFQSRLVGLFMDPFTNAVPEVALLEPSATLNVNTPAEILLDAYAAAADGIRKVEFHTHATKLGEVLEPPYEFLWEHPAAGAYQIFARASSTAGAVSDSPAVTVNVDFGTPAHAKFVGSDVITGGEWRGHYGIEGYWLPGNVLYSNMPACVSIVNTQPWLDYGDPDLPRTLRLPDYTRRTYSFWSGETIEFRMRLTDGYAHKLTIYNYAALWTAPITVRIREPQSQSILDLREIASQDVGIYLSWEIKGEVSIELSALPGGTAFLNAIFLDPIPNHYEDWKREQFLPSERLDPALSGPSVDLDLDLYNNWAEYLLGRNPRKDDLYPPLWVSAERDKLFVHVLAAEVASEEALSVESSPDLRNWLPASDLEPAEIRERLGQRERIYQLPMPPGGASQLRFFRLRIQTP